MKIESKAPDLGTIEFKEDCLRGKWSNIRRYYAVEADDRYRVVSLNIPERFLNLFYKLFGSNYIYTHKELAGKHPRVLSKSELSPASEKADETFKSNTKPTKAATIREKLTHKRKKRKRGTVQSAPQKEEDIQRIVYRNMTTDKPLSVPEFAKNAETVLTFVVDLVEQETLGGDTINIGYVGRPETDVEEVEMQAVLRYLLLQDKITGYEIKETKYCLYLTNSELPETSTPGLYTKEKLIAADKALQEMPSANLFPKEIRQNAEKIFEAIKQEYWNRHFGSPKEGFFVKAVLVGREGKVDPGSPESTENLLDQLVLEEHIHSWSYHAKKFKLFIKIDAKDEVSSSDLSECWRNKELITQKQVEE